MNNIKTDIKINSQSDYHNKDRLVCPSCGYPKLSEHPLCFFCYFRGCSNTTKMFFLQVIKECGAVNVYDLVDAMNHHEMNVFNKVFTYKQVYIRCYNLYKIKLVSKKNIPNADMTNVIGIHKINKLGADRLGKYWKLWDEGRIVGLMYGNGYKKITRNPINKFKHVEIAKRLRDGEYGRYDFLFAEELRKRYNRIDIEKERIVEENFSEGFST